MEILRLIILVSAFILATNSTLAMTRYIAADENFESELRAALVEADSSGAGPYEIVLPAGEFHLFRSLTIDGSNIRFRGAGAKNTILNFKHSQFGAEGILVRGQNIVVEDLSIVDAEGDGIKIMRSKYVTLRGLHVTWRYEEDTPPGEYGGYAIYPVMSQYVLVEECESSYASDAGIYIGQSRDVILRNNVMHHNAIGLEAENSINVDMINNHSYANSVGVVLLAIPDIPAKTLKNIRILGNIIESNNTPNMGVPTAVVADLPPGVGILMVGPDYVEIANNKIHDHATSAILLVHYDILGPEDDEEFEGTPEAVWITENEISESGYDPMAGLSFKSRMLIRLVQLRVSASFFDLPDIMWDGVHNRDSEVPALCITNNSHVTFANFNWPRRLVRIKRSLRAHNCQLPRLDPVEWDSPDSLDQSAHIELPGKLSQLNAVQYLPESQTMVPLQGSYYSLSSPLYSDHADKFRTVVIPGGHQIKYRDQFALKFPEGTLLTKTFSHHVVGRGYMPLETRVLKMVGSQWQGASYVWDPQGEDATLIPEGTVLRKTVLIANQEHHLEHLVPSVHECVSCHGKTWGPGDFPQMYPLGPQARQLMDPPEDGSNQDPQLLTWFAKGWLDRLPDDLPVKSSNWRDSSSGTSEQLARDYLDMNCAHCHNPHGTAANTGFYPSYFIHKERLLGFCKPPVSAANSVGHTQYDLVPGKPEESLILWRMHSNRKDTQMPEVGRSIVHRRGLDLVSAWIASLSGNCP